MQQKERKILPGNYRQISLTLIACKIMEGIVRTEIEIFLFKFNLLSKHHMDLSKTSLVPQLISNTRFYFIKFVTKAT